MPSNNRLWCVNGAIKVATSGLREYVEEHLKHAGLDHIFNSKLNNLVTVAEVAQGKPAPVRIPHSLILTLNRPR